MRALPTRIKSRLCGQRLSTRSAPGDSGSRDLKAGLGMLDEDDRDATLRYLLYEVSELRSLIRHLLAESPRYAEFIRSTSSSFDFQWGHIKDGVALRSDPEFLKRCRGLVASYTGLPEHWFNGKRVLDAGSGNGRWSATFCELGAQVTAFDISEHGVAETQRECAGHPAKIFRHSVLEPIPTEETYDLVWSYGVLHHTGDTYRGFQNLVPKVAPRGHLFLMLYGEPRLENMIEFKELNLYQALRWQLRGLDNEKKAHSLQSILQPHLVHGFFDAVSPPINDCYDRSEVVGWLRTAGFEEIRETLDNRNIHIVARKR